MGDRYFLTIECPKCKAVDNDVYYAPTCGFKTWRCPKCGKKVDLEKYTGITEADASNADLIDSILHRFVKEAK